MSHQITRGFQTGSRSLMRFTGSSLNTVLTANGDDGPEFEKSVSSITDMIEKADSRIITANIQGALAHLSSKDKSDPEKVITVGLHTASGKPIGSIHVHHSGTFKFFANRAGKQGGFDQNIQRAEIPGYIPISEQIEGEAETSTSLDPKNAG